MAENYVWSLEPKQRERLRGLRNSHRPSRIYLPRATILYGANESPHMIEVSTTTMAKVMEWGNKEHTSTKIGC